ncbi:hypothetical protein KSP39_PZI022468 [Platanthera zijinensis]|uniref:Uncharacterized protein n=1 Tax=Platanthera zijinensis TaxID=2320716 RepID=A0AAP0AVD3_9ASPA
MGIEALAASGESRRVLIRQEAFLEGRQFLLGGYGLLESRVCEVNCVGLSASAGVVTDHVGEILDSFTPSQPLPLPVPHPAPPPVTAAFLHVSPSLTSLYTPQKAGAGDPSAIPSICRISAAHSGMGLARLRREREAVLLRRDELDGDLQILRDEKSQKKLSEEVGELSESEEEEVESKDNHPDEIAFDNEVAGLKSNFLSRVQNLLKRSSPPAADTQPGKRKRGEDEPVELTFLRDDLPAGTCLK